MNRNKQKKHKDIVAWSVAVLVCGAVFASTFYVYPSATLKDESIMAQAEENTKQLKWTKQAIEEGTTVDASYLWPDELNPAFTSIYRNGVQLEENKMVTITTGSVYHFRGKSDESILYTEVYVGTTAGIETISGEAATWYRLLPSSIRDEFENSGWIWESGWEYTGRAYLDSDNKRVMIKNGSPSAVLYGIGLYLDDRHNYTSDEAFIQEGSDFVTAFGDEDNLFAMALEQYYTKGGELRTKCPKIYAMVAEALSELDSETAQIRDNMTTSEGSGTNSTDAEQTTNPRLMKELLEYVNNKRAEVGLSSVSWNDADDDNILIRLDEVSVLFSQTRPDGTDAFSAYTDAVMCEMRVADVTTMESVYDCASSYFLMADVKSFCCAIHDDIVVLVFVW